MSSIYIDPVGVRTWMRLKAWQPEYLSGAKSVSLAGRELPLRVGATLNGITRVLCVGPGEWLIVSEEHSAASIREHTEVDLHTYGLALVDLTDGLATVEVRGSPVRDLLSKGCGLDLHLGAFGPGQCARTRFAQIPVIIECLDHPQASGLENSRFELSTTRSYFSYLQDWLADAAAEFGGSLR